MSIDKLQEKIRKRKNPSVIDFDVLPEHIPPYLMEEEGTFVKAYGRFCLEIMEGLQQIVPAVRFHFSTFALLGGEGLSLLTYLLNRAKDCGYYVLLDSVEVLSADAAKAACQALMQLPCDAVVLCSYIGSDGLKPYIKEIKNSGRAVFAVLRTANKSAPELQDLMTGSRLVYMAAADILNRLGEPLIGRSGYSEVAGIGPASSADSLRSLRGKYKRMFLMAEGYDYANANAKNCSFAFDTLGHGACVCAGSTVTAAWFHENLDSTEYVTAAVAAAERMKKNLTRYVSVL